MSHLGENIAAFVFDEMPTAERIEAQRHLEQCADCRDKVGKFEQTKAILRMSLDVDPPRQTIFEVSRPARISWAWRWLAPMGSAVAASIVTAMFMTPGQPAAVPASAPVVAASLPVVEQPSARPTADYERLQAWAVELEKKQSAEMREIQRVRGDVDLLARQQLAAQRDAMETKSWTQQLAMKSSSEE